MGLSWAAAWLVLRALLPGDCCGGDALDFAIVGLIAGAGFSVVLRIAERRRTFGGLPFLRIAGWGAGGGVFLMASWATVVVILGIPLFGISWEVLLGMALYAVFGAASAAASLALARKGRGQRVARGW